VAEVFRARVGKKRPKAAFVALGLALWAGTIPVLALVIATGVVPLLTLMVHCLLFGTMALSYGTRSTKNARFDDGMLTVDEHRLALDGATLATREELTQGYLVPTQQGTLVRLERRGLHPGIVLRVADEQVGRALLQALGFDAAHAVAEMRIASQLIAFNMLTQLAVTMPAVGVGMAAIFAIAATLRAQGGPFVFAVVALMLTYMLGLAFAPTTVRIGTDGIATRWLWRERFIPFSTIAKTEKYDEYVASKRQRGVRLTLTNGEAVRLPTGQTDIGEVEAARLLTRIEEARAARHAGNVSPDLLVRGDRDVAGWVRALRGIGEGAQQLRASALPIDVLLQLVEDASAREVDRASAAVAALASADAEAKRRVRVAAETTASPKLRVALNRIAEDPEEAEIGAVLGTLDERS
jgi:hypothetical protein